MVGSLGRTYESLAHLNDCKYRKTSFLCLLFSRLRYIQLHPILFSITSTLIKTCDRARDLADNLQSTSTPLVSSHVTKRLVTHLKCFRSLYTHLRSFMLSSTTIFACRVDDNNSDKEIIACERNTQFWIILPKARN